MNIFIGCSSKNEIDKKYFKNIEKVCNILNKNNNLVFGVYSKGIMGYVYRSFKKNNQHVIGITNDTYKEEFKTVPCEKELIVYNTFDRTKEIYYNADIYLFFPGGIGTYCEFFSILEELRTYQISKKIILYNCNNYFKDLIMLIENLINNNFAEKSIINYIKVINNEEELIKIVYN